MQVYSLLHTSRFVASWKCLGYKSGLFLTQSAAVGKWKKNAVELWCHVMDLLELILRMGLNVEIFSGRKNVLQFLSITAHNLIWPNMVFQYSKVPIQKENKIQHMRLSQCSYTTQFNCNTFFNKMYIKPIVNSTVMPSCINNSCWAFCSIKRHSICHHRYIVSAGPKTFSLHGKSSSLRDYVIMPCKTSSPLDLVPNLVLFWE